MISEAGVGQSITKAEVTEADEKLHQEQEPGGALSMKSLGVCLTHPCGFAWRSEKVAELADEDGGVLNVCFWTPGRRIWLIVDSHRVSSTFYGKC